MPKLPRDVLPEIRLDSAAAFVETALAASQRRDLFEHPGMTVVAIVELASRSYTGHAEGEDRSPRVKLRVMSCEVARCESETAALLEAQRAMWRGRRVDGTLDEVGPGPRDASSLLKSAFSGYPSEAEFGRHLSLDGRGTSLT